MIQKVLFGWLGSALRLLPNIWETLVLVPRSKRGKFPCRRWSCTELGTRLASRGSGLDAQGHMIPAMLPELMPKL